MFNYYYKNNFRIYNKKDGIVRRGGGEGYEDEVEEKYEQKQVEKYW